MNVKKKLIVLGVFSLGYLFPTASFAAAAASDVERDAAFASTRKVCEDSAPKLATQIARYGKCQKDAEELINTLNMLDPLASVNIQRSLQLAKEADGLMPEIVALSKTFFGALAALDEKYPEGSQKILQESLDGRMESYYLIASGFVAISKATAAEGTQGASAQF